MTAPRGEAPCGPAPSWRFLGTLVGVGLAWRLVINALTAMPSVDGVNYLWMAEQFAAGRACTALSEIFSPLLALWIEVPVALGVEPFAAGQIALAVAGALAVVPMVRIGEQLHPGAGRCAGCLAFVASRPVTLGAEIYTEPLFILVAGYAFLFGLRKRYLLCGTLSGLAFWIRPEAAILPVVFLLSTKFERRAWLAFLPLAVAIAGLAVWRGLCGHGYDPVPKLAFIRAYNVAADLSALSRLLDVPITFFEAFGAAALLAIYGLFSRRPPPALWLMFFAVVIIWAYVPRWRFFVNWMFVVAPLAASGLVRLPGRKWWLIAIVAVHVGHAVIHARGTDRTVERLVAEHLRARLATEETVATDMTRVKYFAGFRPLSPRHYTADELIEAARTARFVVLRTGRDTTPAVRAALTGFVPTVLPAELLRSAEDRGMTVLEPR